MLLMPFSRTRMLRHPVVQFVVALGCSFAERQRDPAIGLDLNAGDGSARLLDLANRARDRKPAPPARGLLRRFQAFGLVGPRRRLLLLRASRLKLLETVGRCWVMKFFEAVGEVVDFERD